MTPGRVRDRGADVRADELGWDEELGPPLDVLAFQGVDGVAGPDAVGALEYPEVNAAATGGAALDLDVGMS